MGTPTDLASAPNAQWTILVYTERGPGHVEQAATDKQLIIQKTGRTDCYVISQSDVSNIYFGAYRTIDDPKDRREAQRAHADLEMLKKLRAVRGRPDRARAGQAVRALWRCVQMSAPTPIRRRSGTWRTWTRRRTPRTRPARSGRCRSWRSRGWPSGSNTRLRWSATCGRRASRRTTTTASRSAPCASARGRRWR